jgi:pimeloyl-ACP methyl ester carboxylesterase
MDSLEVIDFVLPQGMTMCAFDFSGSGQSEGEYVSFGYYEQRDVDCVVQHLLSHRQVTDIVLWGRSMGAVAALLYTSNHHFVRCVVADSPFVNFKDLCLKVIESYHIPRFLSGYIVDKLRATVLEKAGFLIEDVDTLRAVAQCSMPLIFIHSAQDLLVNIDQSRRLFEVCRSESTFLEVQGSHNAMRAEQVVKKAVEEVLHHLTPKQEMEEETAPTDVSLSPRVKEFIQRERPAHSRNETKSWNSTYPEQLFKQALSELQRY